MAIDALKRFPPEIFSNEHINHFADTYTEFKTSILNPAPQYRNIRSLSYVVTDVFTLFHESTGEAVEYFWKNVSVEKLGYLRENKLLKILERGKIRGRIEYDYVIDLIVAAEQEGRITKDEAVKLSDMIGAFEDRKSRK